MAELIAPHGGKLNERLVDRDEASRLLGKTSGDALPLDAVAEADLEMLGAGGYSPLEGFLTNRDRQGVAENMRLANGTLWAIPITLGVSAERAKGIKPGQLLGLQNTAGKIAGVIEVADVYERDLAAECKHVFRTDDKAHPGVAEVMARGPWCVGGKVSVFPATEAPEFADRRLTPRQSREAFAQRGWKRVVAFQTRNPIHRAHEYILKCALELCDGLFLHPLVGFTKSDDIPANVRMQCYDALMRSSMPADRVVLSVLPAPMRYAGPREAVHHALMRKNYGASHFIVGRDHAGVGTYYGTYDAQKIFDTIPAADLGIEPMRFEHSFWCKSCGQMASTKTCPHDNTHHVVLSGTKVREMLKKGERPPVEFTRPEIADALITWAKGG